MRSILFAVSLAFIALSVGTARAAGDGSPLRAVCTVGPIRCLTILRTDVPVRTDPSATHDGYGPADLRNAYKLPTGSGAGQTVAVVAAYDNPKAEADLAVYRAYYRLPPCTTANGCFRKVNQRGEAGNYPRPNANWAVEISLDLDMVSAVCPRCRILLVEADSADLTAVAGSSLQTSDLGMSVDTAVRLGANVVSNSYGTVGPESDWRAWDHYYNHPGVAITASSGDFGYGVIWPAASPYVTAVGGTSLTRAANSRGWTESVWGSFLPGLPPGVVGTGSGCSIWEPKPAWQHDRGCSNRTVADVAAVADPYTGVTIYDSFQQKGWLVVGGTSASSPIIAGVYALAGNASSVHYGSYPYSHTRHLYDVTTGSNFTPNQACGYLCTAGPGYDGPTGLGTPRGAGAF